MEQPLRAGRSAKPASSGIAETLTPLEISASVTLKSAGSKVPLCAKTTAMRAPSEMKIFIWNNCAGDTGKFENPGYHDYVVPFHLYLLFSHPGKRSNLPEATGR